MLYVLQNTFYFSKPKTISRNIRIPLTWKIINITNTTPIFSNRRDNVILNYINVTCGGKRPHLSVSVCTSILEIIHFHKYCANYPQVLTIVVYEYLCRFSQLHYISNNS